MSVTSARAKEVFLGSLEFDRPELRLAYLNEACAGDNGLRRRVEALLEAHRHSCSPLDRAAIEATGIDLEMESPGAPVSELIGTIIGPYRLMEQIGEGGMGVVFVAEQTMPIRRRVALKVIKPGMDTKQVIARFEAERQALAMMDHPNIARVLDGGATESGRPYFVMELVRGTPITEYCDREQLSIPERLDLFILVCRAVQHAHQKGIIHRDLKPSNVLVTTIDGAAVPKVIDFGVAKATGVSLTEQTIYTAFHQMVGTPMYMSPEQANLAGIDVDTRSDIYSLGVLLYELLTGSTPFDSETLKRVAFDEIRRIIREEEPAKPSTRLSTPGEGLSTVSARRKADPKCLGRSMRGELDWIVMKSLEKDRRRRYETANDFAADVMNYLADRPVEARPPSVRYRFSKYARRNKTLLTTVALVAMALIAGTAASLWQAVRATRADRRTAAALKEANGQRILAERHLHASLLQQARQAIDLNLLDRAREILVGPFAVNDGGRSHDFARGYLRRFFPIEERIGDAASFLAPFILSPDGRDLAIKTGDNEIVLWDLAAGRPRIRLPKHRLTIASVAFSHDGSRLASAATDGDHAAGEARIWDARSGRMLTEITLPAPFRLWDIQFTANPRSLLLLVDDGVESRLRSIHYDLGPDPLRPAPVQGRTTPTVHELSHLPAFHGVLTSDGNMISNFGSGRLAKYNPISGKEAWSFQTNARDDLQYAASPEGQFLVTVIDRRQIIVIDTANGSVRNRVEQEHNPRCVYSVLVGPRAMCFVVIDDSGASVWKKSRKVAYRLDSVSLGHPEQRVSAALSPDGERLSLARYGIPGGQEPIRIYDLATGKALATYAERLDCQITKSVFAPDGRSVFFTQCDSIVRWFFDRSGTGAQPLGHADEAWAVAFSPDGKTLASGSDNTKPGDTIKLWNTATSKLTKGWRGPQGTVSSLAFSPDGKLLASATIHQSVNLHLWNAATGKPVAVLKGHSDRVRSVAFSPDGKTLASAGSDRTVRLWDVEGRRPVATLTGHSDAVRGVAFSHDGMTLASASNDRTVRLWDVREASPMRTIDSPMRFAAVAFSPDGSSLAAADQDGGITLWDPATGDRKLAIHGSDSQLIAMAFSPDGQTIATAGKGKSIRLWDALTGQEILTLEGHEAQINGLAFSPDGKTLASCSHDGAVRLWRSEEPRPAP